MFDGYMISFGVTALVLAVIFVNGATDAANAVAGAVASGSLSFVKAGAVCAAFNFLGMFFSSLWMPAVSHTISGLSDFGENATCAVCAVMLSIIIFAGAAWAFGIPTSESHALIAALGGAGAYFGGFSSGGRGFVIIIVKSVLSCVAGCIIGAVTLILIRRMFNKGGFFSLGRRRSKLQAITAAGISFFHGMQDGQKFVALLLLFSYPLCGDSYRAIAVGICSIVMGMGCLCGGRRIINKLGYELTGGFDAADSAASDIGAVFCIAAASCLGIPVSTTYMKTCSMIGASAALKRKPDRRVLIELAVVWTATYPVCMGLAYSLCGILNRFI